MKGPYKTHCGHVTITLALTSWASSSQSRPGVAVSEARDWKLLLRFVRRRKRKVWRCAQPQTAEVSTRHRQASGVGSATTNFYYPLFLRLKRTCMPIQSMLQFPFATPLRSLLHARRPYVCSNDAENASISAQLFASRPPTPAHYLWPLRVPALQPRTLNSFQQLQA